MFDDPFLVAFRGKGPQQHLYTVSFSTRDLWKEGHEESATEKGIVASMLYISGMFSYCSHISGVDDAVDDRVTLEIYQEWLQLPSLTTSASDNEVTYVIITLMNA